MEFVAVTRISAMISEHADQLLDEWASRVMALPRAQELAHPSLIDHMPQLIHDLAELIRKTEELPIDATPSNGNGSSEAHGSTRFAEGFDIVEVVAEYNILREVLFDFEKREGPFSRLIERIIHRTIDHAIAFAVKAYATQQACELQRRRREHLSFVVHDLKTPLSAIQMATILLNNRGNPGVDTNKFLAVISRNADRLQQLIQNLIDENSPSQSEGAGLEKRTFDAWPVAEAVIRDLSTLAEKQNTAILNQVPDDLIVFADAHALSRVLQNLLSNSIKHTKGGSIVVGGRPTVDRAEFWVRDSGEGIAPDQLAKIFNKRETNDTAEGGSGLGLAVVRDIVQAHGGQVTVESTRGKGATFTFTLPKCAT